MTYRLQHLAEEHTAILATTLRTWARSVSYSSCSCQPLSPQGGPGPLPGLQGRPPSVDQQEVARPVLAFPDPPPPLLPLAYHLPSLLLGLSLLSPSSPHTGDCYLCLSCAPAMSPALAYFCLSFSSSLGFLTPTSSGSRGCRPIPWHLPHLFSGRRNPYC